MALRYQQGRLLVAVSDDGRGGAVTTSGGGLHGLARRLSALDGTIAVTSPAGGPTVVTMEIPCQPVRADSPPGPRPPAVPGGRPPEGSPLP